MAPSLALEGLANAAAEAASGALSPPRFVAHLLSSPRVYASFADLFRFLGSLRVMRMKKRKRAEPPPRNAFPDVVTKGLVTEDEARELYNTSVLLSAFLTPYQRLTVAPS